MSDDDIYFSKALAEYRDDSGDDSDFVDLEPAVQSQILKRAQELSAQRERERGLKFQVCNTLKKPMQLPCNLSRRPSESLLRPHAIPIAPPRPPQTRAASF